MSFLIVPDIHIGKSLSLGRVSIGSQMNSRLTDQLALLDWILAHAIARAINHIIITGDVFDDVKPAPYLLALFISWLKKCEANDIHVHIIQGNHDMLRTGTNNASSLDVIIEADLPTVSVYKDITTIFVGTTAITLVPFRDRKFFNLDSNSAALDYVSNILAYELASIPSHYRKILVGHLAIEGAIYIGDEVDDVANELICPLDMFAGYDYVWMGHIHKHQTLQTKTANRPLIAHVGSMDISDFGEVGESKVIITIDEIIETITLPTRVLMKAPIVIPADIKDGTQFVIDQLAAISNLSNAIVRVEIQISSPETLPLDRNAIEKVLYTAGVFNVSGILQSKTTTTVKKKEAALTTSMDVPSSIKTWITSKVPEAMQEAALTVSIDCHREMLEAAK
jgi:exonuclease SbcD